MDVRQVSATMSPKVPTLFNLYAQLGHLTISRLCASVKRAGIEPTANVTFSANGTEEPSA